MKKIIFTLIAAILLSASIVGCSTGNEKSPEPSPDKVTANQEEKSSQTNTDADILDTEELPASE